METTQFKTNINCGGCVSAVTPHMTNEEKIIKWKVDTNNPQKILTVETTDMSADEIIQVIKKAGFTAEKV